MEELKVFWIVATFLALMSAAFTVYRRLILPSLESLGRPPHHADPRAPYRRTAAHGSGRSRFLATVDC
jgi:hypothetical protein